MLCFNLSFLWLTVRTIRMEEPRKQCVFYFYYYYYKQLQTSCCLTLVTLLREYWSLQVGFFGLVYKVQLPDVCQQQRHAWPVSLRLWLARTWSCSWSGCLVCAPSCRPGATAAQICQSNSHFWKLSLLWQLLLKVQCQWCFLVHSVLSAVGH